MAITIEIYNETSRDWIDLTQYMAYQSMEGSEAAVEGNAKGESINGLTIRDILRYRKAFPFVSIPIELTTAHSIRSMMLAERVSIRTNYFTGITTNYDMYADGLVISHIVDKANDTSMVKMSFTLTEI